jgi:hypothetical protein
MDDFPDARCYLDSFATAIFGFSGLAAKKQKEHKE